jgi:hypothetical protein
MTTVKKEKKLCWFGLLVLPEKALLPTCIETDQGDFDVEPIRQIDYRNRQDLVDAIENAISVGNPPGEAPSREKRKERTPMEKLAGAKSWADLERKSIYFSIKVYPSDFQIKSWGRASDGTWSDEKETALDVKIPKEAGAEGIADAILEHLSQRNDLLGLAT